VPVAEVVSARTQHARELFAPLGPTYDRYARLLSLGQDPRWRRFLVSRVEARPHDVVLDVATGTGAVARELVRRTGCSVVGVDQSREMLAAARGRTAGGRIRFVEATAEALPFEAGAFAALTFTYLLRYVDDPTATMRELVRVIRPGGTVAMLEFALPPNRFARRLWDLYVDIGLPSVSRLIAPGWAEVGRFLGGSIRDFYARYPLDRLLRFWEDAGVAFPRFRLLSLGGAVVVWGRRSWRPRRGPPSTRSRPAAGAIT
jgi:demethylmenaquinone methyltransferase/2-methoxy-6-polyprenyl-1,4-benzoquinol methylase